MVARCKQARKSSQISCGVGIGATWVKEAIQAQITRGDPFENMDAYHLSIKPNLLTLSYNKIMAYGNHCKVN